MFLYDEKGEVVGHLSPKKMSPEEKAQDRAMQEDLARRFGHELPPEKAGPEPMEIRFGRLEDPISQAKLEWAAEGVRKLKGVQAAENFYQLGLAADKGKDALTAKFEELFPDKKASSPAS